MSAGSCRTHTYVCIRAHTHTLYTYNSCYTGKRLFSYKWVYACFNVIDWQANPVLGGGCSRLITYVQPACTFCFHFTSIPIVETWKIGITLRYKNDRSKLFPLSRNATFVIQTNRLNDLKQNKKYSKHFVENRLKIFTRFLHRNKINKLATLFRYGRQLFITAYVISYTLRRHFRYVLSYIMYANGAYTLHLKREIGRVYESAEFLPRNRFAIFIKINEHISRYL